MEERVVEKLALIPHHTKFVVGPSEFRSIHKVPETLHVKYPAGKVLGADEVPETLDARPYSARQFFHRMIDIFSKRWQTLDLISMLQELKRTESTDYPMGYMHREIVSIKDSLSTLPTFQKKEEEHST